MFKIRISHSTHTCLASNINLSQNLYLDPPNAIFVQEHADIYGDINEEGVRKLVLPEITSIITGACLVIISDGIISKVSKAKFIEECIPKNKIPKEKNTQILTNNGVINITIPPPPSKPPPRLPQNVRLIHQAKQKNAGRVKLSSQASNNFIQNRNPNDSGNTRESIV